MANYDNYIKIVDETRGILKKEKEEGFKKFCNSLNPCTPYDLICKGVKNLKRRFLDTKEFSIPKFEIVKDIELYNCYDKISKNYRYGDIHDRIYSEYRYDETSVLNNEISSLEVGVAINNSKK